METRVNQGWPQNGGKTSAYNKNQLMMRAMQKQYANNCLAHIKKKFKSVSNELHKCRSFSTCATFYTQPKIKSGASELI